MSTFWSRWVMVLMVFNLGVTIFLFVWGQLMSIPTETDGTTGHVWAHGVLREAVRKLPLWWVLISVGTFIFGFAYLALYPAFGNYKGVLEWTSEEQWQRETAANNAKIEALIQPTRTLSIEQLAADPTTAANGRRLYLDNCAGCHGINALGNQVIGAPDLTDAEWVYGGDSAMVLASISNGRNGVMPALGETLGRQGVNEVASYVVSLSGVKAPEDWVAAGKTRFETLCVACHGADGRGNPALGAPNLTDKIWLYGGEFENVVASIRDGRSGVMPGWSRRMNEDQIRVLTTWVYAQSHRNFAAKP